MTSHVEEFVQGTGDTEGYIKRRGSDYACSYGYEANQNRYTRWIDKHDWVSWLQQNSQITLDV